MLIEHVQSSLIGEQDALLRIEHQDAGAHALQDLGVQGFEVGDFLGALPSQGLTDLQAAREALHQQRGGETQGAECRRLHVLGAGFAVVQAEVEGQVDKAGGGNCGDEEADASSQQDVGDGDGNDQQVADAAGGTSSEVEQRREQ